MFLNAILFFLAWCLVGLVVGIILGKILKWRSNEFRGD